MIRNQSPIRSSPRLPPNNPFAIEEFSGRIAQPIAGEFISPKFAILRKKFLCQFKNRPANSCSPMMPVQLSLVKSLGTAVKADDTRSKMAAHSHCRSKSREPFQLGRASCRERVGQDV